MTKQKVSFEMLTEVTVPTIDVSELVNGNFNHTKRRKNNMSMKEVITEMTLRITNIEKMPEENIEDYMSADKSLEHQRKIEKYLKEQVGLDDAKITDVQHFVIDLEKKKLPPIIAVDFDGTLCKNKWPEIGAPNMNLIIYLKERQAAGAKLILWTCRTGELLQEAVDWCISYGLIFDTVNANLPEVIETMGGDTRKIYADEYIDDKTVTIVF